MKGNGLVLWFLGGVGIILVYAAYTNSTVAEVLAGKAGSTAKSTTSTGIPGISGQTLTDAGNAAGKVAGDDATKSVNDWLNSAAGKAQIAADAAKAAQQALKANPSSFNTDGSSSGLVPAQYANNPALWTGAA